MKNYSGMSDFEINKEVAYFKIEGDWSLEPSDERKFTFYNLDVKTKNTVELPDYCSNPADAWPIIHDEMISIVFDDDGYDTSQSAWCKATNPRGDEYYDDIHRPLRAAMIVYLIMKEKCGHCGGDGHVEIKHTEFEIEQHLCHHCNKEES